MSRLRGKGPKISLNRPQTTPEPPVVPPNLEKHTTITIDNETFEIEADDLEVISQLGKIIDTNFEWNVIGLFIFLFRSRSLWHCREDEAQKDRDYPCCQEDRGHCQQHREQETVDGPGHQHEVL